MPKDLKAVSKGEYQVNGNAVPNAETLQVSCLMRIADAAEVMAKNYSQLFDERNKFERYYLQEKTKTAKLERRIIALKGVITRQKHKADVE